MAVFTFKHSFVSRGKHAPGTAAAHINYITRKAATCLVRAEGIVKPPGMDLRGALWRFTNEREASIRKNGRVMDKFIIALPKEMSLAEMDGCLDRFGRRIKLRWCPEQGRLLRGVFGYTIQDFDTHNPHAHCVFYDADQKTGERVFGTTKKGSTERLRAAWEDTANAELERLGYEARIDRRPQRVIDAELEAAVAGPAEGSPEVHTEGLPEGVEATPPHAPTETLEEPAPEEQADHIGDVTEKVSGHLPEPDMAREDEQPEGAGHIVAGKPPETVVGKVQQFSQLHARLAELQAARQKLWDLQTAFEVAHRGFEQNKQALDAAIAAADNAADSRNLRRMDMMAHQTASGRLRGFSLFGLKTQARKAAEQAQASLREAEDTYKTAERAYGRQALAVSRAQSETRDANSNLQEYEYQLVFRRATLTP